MRFKNFITKQRIIIFVAGLVMFGVTLSLAAVIGFSSLSGTLFIDLAASSITIILTALIIDYLGMTEQRDKTKTASNLAKGEIQAICRSIEFGLARLYGLKIDRSARVGISTKEQARSYIESLTSEVESYLAADSLFKDKGALDIKTLEDYYVRLERSRAELEQILMLYEYALSYRLKESILSLRNEFQVSERLLSFIDKSEELTDANFSLITVASESVYNAVESVLPYVTRPTK